VLVHVGERVEPEKVRPFEDAQAEIKRDLAMDKAKAQLSEQRDKVEDERGAGAPLAQVAKKLNLATRIVPAIDRSGRDPGGAVVADLPQADFLNAAFASDVGGENDPVAVQGGGFVWYEVLNVTPSRDRALDEVKDRVEERWRNAEVTARLKTKAADMVEKLKGNVTFAEIASAAGGTPQTATGIKRGKATPGLSADASTAIFRLNKGEAGDAEGDQPTERVIFRVSDIKVPALDPNSPDAKSAAENVRPAYLDELLSQYVVQLEADLGTTVNESALAQVLGGGQQQ
jgi:peptidyl-prolyl cis-trans isomerase D